MDRGDLPSDSDESDEDYIPTGENDLLSEEDSDGEPEGIVRDEEETEESTGKRKAKQKKKGKKRQKVDMVEGSPTEEKIEVNEEEEKKKTDLLWSDFMKDTSKPLKRTDLPTEENKTKPETKSAEKAKVTITKVFHFAGEEVKVTKEVPADSPECLLTPNPPSGDKSTPASTPTTGGSSSATPRPPFSARRPPVKGGLSAVLGQLGKKDKIGTLEKSKLDWDRFKKTEGLEEELQVFNRGKEGYLEKQDFLQRADLRQFEIEKQLRSRRGNR